ncbi:MAG: glycosyltransferase family 2 protein [Lautropia sp.]
MIVAAPASPGRLITVCIPTRNRPVLLTLALQSVMRQDYRPIEVLVGDNSNDDTAAHVVAGIECPPGITLRYHRNVPPCDAAENVQQLFDRAGGDRLLTLHDDDLLVDNALTVLAASWDSHPDSACVFGKHYIMTEGGETLARATDEANRLYFRVRATAGRQDSPIEAGLRQQVPMNGFLVDTKLARQVGMRPSAVVGCSCDADFGVRAGIAAGSRAFVYVDRFVSFYRLTESSILRDSRTNYGQHLFYQAISSLPLPAEVADSRRLMLTRIAPLAVLNAAMAGERRLALRLLRSEHYTLPWFGASTLRRLVCILSPRLHDKLLPLGRRLRRHRPTMFDAATTDGMASDSKQGSMGR